MMDIIYQINFMRNDEKSGRRELSKVCSMHSTLTTKSFNLLQWKYYGFYKQKLIDRREEVMWLVLDTNENESEKKCELWYRNHKKRE